MSDSPISATPYEVLGVSSTATQDDLRRAYRRLVRETHPDTGGDAERFTSVQVAWERVGDPVIAPHTIEDAPPRGALTLLPPGRRNRARSRPTPALAPVPTGIREAGGGNATSC